MIILFLFLICFLVYSVFLITLPVSISPEFFFYPWLVSKGLVQYRDFFDHHGFITNILLSPVSHPGGVAGISLVFICMQLIQCSLIVKMLIKKIKHPLYSAILFILYLAFEFTIVSQQLWFDTWMAFFIVVAWYLFEEQKELFGWIFVACATMVKPTAILFLLPFFLKSKKKNTITVFFIVWLIPLVYFLVQGAGVQLWKQLILFNTFYIQSTYKTFFIGIPIKLLFIICGGFFSLIIFSLLQKKKNLPLIFMAVISFSFFFQGLSRINFSLFVPFCILLISDMLQNKKMNTIIVVVLSFFTLVMLRDCYKTYKDLQVRQSYLSPTVLQEAKRISSFIPQEGERNILVVGNRVELYYLLNALPPEFTPLHFPWIENVYGDTANLAKVQYIIVPKKFGEYEKMSGSVKSALENSHKIGQTTLYTVWRYNRIYQK